MNFQCELISMPSHPTVCLRTVASVDQLPQILGEAYNVLISYLTELNVIPDAAPYVVYFNQDLQNLEIETGFQIPDTVPDKGKIKCGEVPTSEYLQTLYAGPYDKMESTYNSIMKWIMDSDANPKGTAYEFYLNDPSDTPMNELKTLIMFPLEYTNLKTKPIQFIIAI